MIKPPYLILQLIRILRAVREDCESEKGTVLAHNWMYKIVIWIFSPDLESA
jgi:hypothetical protein